tara:strand:+ start:345 stop:548 length:204 start_codon:yes stop_codon:yes gene_type:complete
MKLPDEWLSPYEWEEWMECTLDEMPPWYSNVNDREEAYSNYIKGVRYYSTVKRDYKDRRKERLKKCL